MPKNMLQKLKNIPFACSVCFSVVKDDPMNVALRASVLCLLAILLVTLGCFVKFFLGVRKRAKVTT